MKLHTSKKLLFLTLFSTITSMDNAIDLTIVKQQLETAVNNGDISAIYSLAERYPKAIFDINATELFVKWAPLVKADQSRSDYDVFVWLQSVGADVDIIANPHCFYTRMHQVTANAPIAHSLITRILNNIIRHETALNALRIEEARRNVVQTGGVEAAIRAVAERLVNEGERSRTQQQRTTNGTRKRKDR